MLVYVLFAVIFGVLVYFSVVGGPTYGPAFVGVAGAWALGIICIEYPVVSGAYRRRVQRKRELEAAYSSLLPLADDYARAWDSYNAAATADENATSDKEAAQKRLGQHYNDENQRALDVANKKLLSAAQSFHKARQESEKRCEEYRGVRDNVKRLASHRVQSALADFDKSLTKESAARDKARSGFVNAVRADLHQPRWPNPHS